MQRMLALGAALLVALAPAAAAERAGRAGGERAPATQPESPAATDASDEEDAPVVHLPVSPPGLPSPKPPERTRETRAACIDMDEVVEAVVMNDSSIQLTSGNGKQWRMYFGVVCPFLGFYEGFYYRREKDGLLCAGKDSVVARSGAECLIQDIVSLKPTSGR